LEIDQSFKSVMAWQMVFPMFNLHMPGLNAQQHFVVAEFSGQA
jgi:hypothetical protein